MKSVPLTAYPRALSRRGGARKLRSAGRVPAVIYGGHTQPQNLEIDLKSLEDLIHHSASENLLVDLAVEQDARPKRLALVKEVQHYPLTGKVLHIDFHEISETEKVTVMVPVEPVGEATGVKNGGGVLEHVLFKVKVRSLPKDLPEVIHVDVSRLEIGQAVHIGEITAPPGVEVLGDKNIPVSAGSSGGSGGRGAGRGRDDQGEKGRRRRRGATCRQSGRGGRRQSARSGGGQSGGESSGGQSPGQGGREEARGEEEVTRLRLGPRVLHGELASHCGLGEPGTPLRAHPA